MLIFFQTVKAGCVLQCRVNLVFFFCWTVLALIWAISPPVKNLLDDFCAPPPKSPSTHRRPLLWADAFHFSSPQHIKDPFVVYMTRGRTFYPLKETRKAVNSALLMVRCTSSLSIQRTVHPTHWLNLLVKSCSTDHPHAPHLPGTPGKEPSVATWFLKPCTGVPQLLWLSDSNFRADKWLLLLLLSLRGCDVIPLCHFKSSFDVFALCSLLTSSNMGSHTMCASLCLLRCYILDTSFHLTKQCRTIFSAPILLPQPASSSHFGAYDFQKHIMFLQKWILNLQYLLQSQSLETVPVCIVWQYFPHDNIVCIHKYDEFVKSIDSGACHRPWSI